MASSTLPWNALWSTLWDLIPSPTTDGYTSHSVDDKAEPAFSDTGILLRRTR
ncbi:MAG: hypothetical protein KZQ83_11280 [gamma proteobacterium symbiont of Taylorina sp.]|nr:hypothetical protein [gamma proteobacterium symbiont of Taylorina sp.]